VEDALEEEQEGAEEVEDESPESMEEMEEQQEPGGEVERPMVCEGVGGGEIIILGGECGAESGGGDVNEGVKGGAEVMDAGGVVLRGRMLEVFERLRGATGGRKDDRDAEGGMFMKAVVVFEDEIPKQWLL